MLKKLLSFEVAMGIAIKKTHTKFEDLIFKIGASHFTGYISSGQANDATQRQNIVCDKDRHNLTALMNFWRNSTPF